MRSMHGAPLAACAALAGVVLSGVVLSGCASSNANQSAVPFEGDALVGVSSRPPIRRAPPEFEDTDASAVRVFYEALAPHGRFRDDARLGLVWSPDTRAIDGLFVPYASHGRWSYRTYEGTPEWVWVSDLSWGSLTFHYGRWVYDGEGGFAWIPGRKYAGAWVDFRMSVDASHVVGWGPRPPSHIWRMSAGPDTSRSGGDVLDPRTAHLEAMPYAAFATPYVYTRAHDLFDAHVFTKLLSGPAAHAVAHATTPIATLSVDALGLDAEAVPAPPALDPGLQQAWMLATPGEAAAVGRGPMLSSPPRLRTYVAGGPRWASR